MLLGIRNMVVNKSLMFSALCIYCSSERQTDIHQIVKVLRTKSRVRGQNSRVVVFKRKFSPGR